MAKVYQRAVVSGHGPGDTLPIALTREARVWSSTKTLSTHDFPHPIADVCFSPARPHDLAVAFGNSISLISQQGGKVRKSFTRFRDIAYSPRFKYDGRLLVAGTADSVVKVFDVSSRTPLRTLYGHRGPVRTTHFSTDGLHVITGSDDTTVKVWDIAEGKNISSLTDGTDYIRAMNHSPASRHVWATGSFDHKARLYDLRTSKCIFTLNHGAQIDDVHILSGGAMVITVGGPEVRLWDLFTGGTLSNSLSCHAKAVTSAAIDGTNKRLLTAGLDGYVKAHDLLSFKTKGVIPVGAQALTLDLSADLRCFAVGKADGVVDIKSSRHVTPGNQTADAADPAPVDDEMRGWGRGFTRVGEKEKALRDAPRPGTYRYFNRGRNAEPDGNAVEIDHVSSKKLSSFDQNLRKFDHVGALEAAMQTNNVDIMLGVADELMNRKALIPTLQRLELQTLCPLLRIMKNNIEDAVRSKKVTLLVNVILDVHADSLCLCNEAIEILKAMQVRLQKEQNLIKDLEQLKGGAEMLLSVSNSRSNW